jgi:MFS family permease
VTRVEQLYHEFPKKFWIVVGVHFIDKIGGTVVFPFFALYITRKFSVGMTEAGILLGLLSLAGIVGSVIGGALTDRWGRRNLILFGLVASALSSLTLGSVNRFAWLFPVAALVGLFSEAGGPAHAAMIADILPKEQRQEGFGILRVVGNMAWLVGPTVGGFVARTSFFALFVIDAVISCSVAVLFYSFMAETKPQPHEKHEQEGFVRTFVNYRIVLRDKAYLAFIVSAVLMGMVYIQMYNSLSVYLRDNHGIEPQGYGFLLTSSAITVICFQIWTMRVIKGKPQFLMMALGTGFYLIGFGMFGVVSAYPLFVAAVVIITAGEMIVVPTSQALAAGFARTDMRGRYMAVFGLSFSLPAALGPVAAGLILDNYAPNLLWHLGALLCGVAAASFYVLHVRLGAEDRFVQSQTRGNAAWLAVVLVGMVLQCAVASAQTGVGLPKGVKRVSFGTAHRYFGPGKEMCVIVYPLPSAAFEKGVTELTYAVELEPQTVKQAAAHVVGDSPQALRSLACNVFTPVRGGFSQTQIGNTISRIDKAPLAPGRYTLHITVDGQTADVPFSVK